MPGLGTSFGRGGATTFQQDLQNSDCIVIMAGFDEATEREWRRFDLGRPTPMGDAVRTGLAVFLESADERAARYPDLPGVAVGEAVAALPIPGQGGVIGAISFRLARRSPTPRTACGS